MKVVGFSLEEGDRYYGKIDGHRFFIGSRICKITDDGVVPLESDISTTPLIDYLNPSHKEVEDTEIIQAAKFVHNKLTADGTFGTKKYSMEQADFVDKLKTHN